MTIKKITKSISPTENKRESSDQNRIGLERLIFFNDAVFAIAITLLALEIRLPTGVEAFSDAQLLTNLLGMWHKYLAYIISFLVIGSFWSAHHRKFRLIKRYDGKLLTYNLLILMVVAFIPFPSSVISESSGRTATIFYALTMMLVGFLFTALWWHASRHNRLIEAHLTAQQHRREFLSPLMTAAIFLLSIGIAFFDADLARLSWVLILPASLYVNKG
jgi:uncharacterized membrane protein